MRLIDADALKASIQRQIDILHMLSSEYDELGQVIKDGFFQKIDNAPTIEQKHGKWIESGLVDVIECSECGWIKTEPYWNYCPHCGTRMDL